MPPTYHRGRFDAKAGADRITCLVGNEAGALPIGQSFKVSRLASRAGRSDIYRPAAGNGVYAFVLEGEAEIASQRLARRDSIALEGEREIRIAAGAPSTDMLLVETKL